MIKLFDSHCHLDDRAYDDDLDQVTKRMHTAGVAAIVIVGTTPQRCVKAVALAESHPGFYASVGIHPHDAQDCSEAAIKHLIDLSQSPRVRAWGEIGLDFNRMYSPRKDQEKWLVRQLEITAELGLPVIFHERDSRGRLIDLIKSEFKPGQAGVIHCFSGDKAELAEYLDRGLHIGITGIVTIKNRGAQLRDLVPFIPADRILLETDAPYLTPSPERNHTRRNEPAFVRSVLLKVAQVRQEDPESLAARIWENTCGLFGIT